MALAVTLTVTLGQRKGQYLAVFGLSAPAWIAFFIEGKYSPVERGHGAVTPTGNALIGQSLGGHFPMG